MLPYLEKIKDWAKQRYSDETDEKNNELFVKLVEKYQINPSMFEEYDRCPGKQDTCYYLKFLIKKGNAGFEPMSYAELQSATYIIETLYHRQPYLAEKKREEQLKKQKLAEEQKKMITVNYHYHYHYHSHYYDIPDRTHDRLQVTLH